MKNASCHKNAAHHVDARHSFSVELWTRYAHACKWQLRRVDSRETAICD